jgi:hypothetical protein
MKSKNSRNQRVALSFIKELDDIQKQRKKQGLDKGLKRGISAVKITEMIPKYQGWREFKEDLITYRFKRGHKRK